MTADIIPSGYESLLADLKNRILNTRVHAALSVNRELILLYWHIGRTILERQEQEGWGSKVIDRLADDLRREFPDMKGLSRANLFYMRAFAEAYPDMSIVQQLVGQLPWGHNVLLITKIKDLSLREWYARACIEHGWNRAVMEVQIETSLHMRQGAAQTNFTHTLPAPQSELAQQILKDPYNFDFLTLHDQAVERDLQKGLLVHLKDFMMELGVGFAFVGNEYHLEVAGEDFYLSAVDDMLRHPQDNPTIGILLCKSKNRVIVEYSLRDIHKPLGIAEYKLAQSLPDDLKGNLPTIEELEKELGDLQEVRDDE